jgi:hypothetical protein
LLQSTCWAMSIIITLDNLQCNKWIASSGEVDEFSSLGDHTN